MAIAFLNNIAFSGGAQAQNLRLENLATDPASGNAGQLYFNTAGNFVKVYNGTAWIDIASSFTWILTADSGTNQTVNDGETVDIEGDTYITTVVGDTNKVTISHDDTTRSDTTSTDTPGYGGNFEAVTSVTTNAQGHVTAIDVSTVTLPASDNTDNYVDSVSFNTSTGVLTLGRTGALVDLTEDLDGRYLELGGGTMTGNIAMGSNSITGLADPQDDQDAATKAYVDGLVEGGLTFKDGFNANTGAIDGGGNLTSGATRVEIEVGDYYVVTTAGDFYGDTSIPLTVGDSVIAKTAAAEGTSTSADWVIVQGDEGVVDLTSGNGANSTGNAITSNTSARGSVTVESFAYAGSTNVGHVPSGGSATTFLRGDGTWVTPTDTQPPVTDVTASTANDELGISISPTTGNVVVGIDINGMDASLGQAAAVDDLLIIYDKSATQNKKVRLDNLLELIGVNRSKRIDLNNSVSGVTRAAAGGITTFTINVETIFGSGTIAQNVMCEVIGNAQNEGDTVYADIGRGPETGSGYNEMTVAFVGSVADGDYQVLLNRIGEFEAV